jgi:hypothetical protein
MPPLPPRVPRVVRVPHGCSRRPWLVHPPITPDERTDARWIHRNPGNARTNHPARPELRAGPDVGRIAGGATSSR